MKDLFPGYYLPNEDEFEKLWNECIFVFDANVLLNFYRYSIETRTELISIIQGISERIWLPHQSASEYQKNRISVIINLEEVYDQVKENLDKELNKFEDLLNGIIGNGRHPILNSKDLLNNFGSSINDIKKNIDNKKQEHPDYRKNDEIRTAIENLFDGKIGGPYSPDKLKEIITVGQKRYDLKIPPGFEDNKNKKYPDNFGDLVLWYQIIDFANSSKKPVIFITDDRKDDWWLREKNKTISPHPQLINEFIKETKQKFYMYSLDPFLEYAKKYLKKQIAEDVITEVRNVRKQDEIDTLYKFFINNLSKKEIYDFVTSKELTKKNKDNLLANQNIKNLLNLYKETKPINELVLDLLKRRNNNEDLLASEERFLKLYLDLYKKDNDDIGNEEDDDNFEIVS